MLNLCSSERRMDQDSRMRVSLANECAFSLDRVHADRTISRHDNAQIMSAFTRPSLGVTLTRSDGFRCFFENKIINR